MTEPTTKKPSYIDSLRTRITDDLTAVVEGAIPADVFIESVLRQIRTSYRNGIAEGEKRKRDV